MLLMINPLKMFPTFNVTYNLYNATRKKKYIYKIFLSASLKGLKGMRWGWINTSEMQTRIYKSEKKHRISIG